MRTVAAATALLLALAGLGACSDDEGTAEPVAVRTALDGSEFNDADAEFATAMVPHLADTLVLVDEALEHGVSAEVRSAAEQVRDVRGPQIEQLVVWLGDWGQPVPETSRDHANAGHPDDGEHSHGDGARAPEGGGQGDPAYEQEWLDDVVAQHEEALELARTEVERGLDPDAVAMAEQMVEGLAAELESLRALQD